MAEMTLTERQKEIKVLLERGNKPDAVAAKLGIRTNAVYQQVKRMREKGVEIAGYGQGNGSRKSGRKSSAPRLRAQRRPAAAAPPQPRTAEDLLRDEIAAAEAKATELRAMIESARKQIEAHEAEIERHVQEAARKLDVLAVLRGEKVAHAKPAPRPVPAANEPAKGNGRNAPAKPASAPASGPSGDAKGNEAGKSDAEEATPTPAAA